MIVAETHPAALIDNFIRAHTEILELELSIYRYQPRNVRDERRIVRVRPTELLTTFQSLSWRLAPGEDIAFHSRVSLSPYFPSPVRHLALLDLHGDTQAEGQSAVFQLVREWSPSGAALFASGRSYHLYGFALLTVEEWIQFMGRSLLLNLPDRSPVVDARWIGHRLMAGYGALRWTQNGAQYIAEPRLIQAY